MRNIFRLPTSMALASNSTNEGASTETTTDGLSQLRYELQAHRQLLAFLATGRKLEYTCAADPTQSNQISSQRIALQTGARPADCEGDLGRLWPSPAKAAQPKPTDPAGTSRQERPGSKSGRENVHPTNSQKEPPARREASAVPQQRHLPIPCSVQPAPTASSVPTLLQPQAYATAAATTTAAATHSSNGSSVSNRPPWCGVFSRRQAAESLPLQPTTRANVGPRQQACQDPRRRSQQPEAQCAKGACQECKEIATDARTGRLDNRPEDGNVAAGGIARTLGELAASAAISVLACTASPLGKTTLGCTTQGSAPNGLMQPPNTAALPNRLRLRLTRSASATRTRSTDVQRPPARHTGTQGAQGQAVAATARQTAEQGAATAVVNAAHGSRRSAVVAPWRSVGKAAEGAVANNTQASSCHITSEARMREVDVRSVTPVPQAPSASPTCHSLVAIGVKERSSCQNSVVVFPEVDRVMQRRERLAALLTLRGRNESSTGASAAINNAAIGDASSCQGNTQQACETRAAPLLSAATSHEQQPPVSTSMHAMLPAQRESSVSQPATKCGVDRRCARKYAGESGAGELPQDSAVGGKAGRFAVCPSHAADAYAAMRAWRARRAAAAAVICRAVRRHLNARLAAEDDRAAFAAVTIARLTQARLLVVWKRVMRTRTALRQRYAGLAAWSSEVTRAPVSAAATGEGLELRAIGNSLPAQLARRCYLPNDGGTDPGVQNEGDTIEPYGLVRAGSWGRTAASRLKYCRDAAAEGGQYGLAAAHRRWWLLRAAWYGLILEAIVPLP